MSSEADLWFPGPTCEFQVNLLVTNDDHHVDRDLVCIAGGPSSE